MAAEAAVASRHQTLGTVGDSVLERDVGGFFNGDNFVLDYRIFRDEVAIARILGTLGVDQGKQVVGFGCELREEVACGVLRIDFRRKIIEFLGGGFEDSINASLRRTNTNVISIESLFVDIAADRWKRIIIIAVIIIIIIIIIITFLVVVRRTVLELLREQIIIFVEIKFPIGENFVFLIL